MEKEKIHIEYSLNATTKNIIWGAISTASGLEGWFADKVKVEDKKFSFTWGKTETRKAEIVNIRTFSFVRFHWLDDDDPKSYFELKMGYNELTGDYSLEVTDIVEKSEADDQRKLWDLQIENLRRNTGM